jgi:CHAD domain-containing protein
MKARRVEGLDPAAPLRSSASRIVQTRLDELRSFVEQALSRDASTAQHDMRIAAKRLRYLLEIVGPCIGKPAEPARGAAKELQALLGEMHDCDLMIAEVETIGSLAEALRERREHRYEEFARLWQAETSKGTWAALEAAL